jgi:hypothetical protein
VVDDVRVRSVSRTIWQGKPVPATLSATNPILIETGSNTDLCGVSWRLTKKEGRKEERKKGSKEASKQARKKERRK